MSEPPDYPASFECVAGVPESRYAAGPDGAMDCLVDPGPTVCFTQVEGSRYRADLNGEPRPIRRKRVYFEQTEAGRRQKWEPELEEGETADLKLMMTGLGFETGQRRIRNGIELTSADNWGHFRQWNYYSTTITVGEDGAIEVLEDLGEMDASYY